MGQQQLLLLVLGTIIVGLSVVAGINTFSSSQKQSNMDALVNDGVRIASDAQAWKSKPAQFGGGADDAWNSFSWSDIGLEANANGNYDTPNGVFAINAASSTDDSLVVDGTNATQGNKVTIAISGISSDSIATTLDPSYTAP